MATGDWSFPRSGCSCIRFKTQIAQRPWIGCQLWPTFAPFADTTTRRTFLRVHQDWSATPIFAARAFDAEWSTAPETFGRIASSGGNPQPTTNGYLFTLTNINDFHPYVTARGTGQYVFEKNWLVPNATLQLVSFTASDSTSIEITETEDIVYNGIGPNAPRARATIKRKWDRELTPAMMLERLTADLEDEIPFDYTNELGAYPTNLVSNSVVPNIGENQKAWARGGVVEFTDNNYTMGAASREGVNLENNDVFEPLFYGHAHSRMSRLLTQGYYIGPNNARWPASASRSRCLIYQPGQHRFETKSFLTNETVAFCQNLDVECPAESQDSGALYILQPPSEKDLEKKELYLNSQCPTP